VVSVTDPYGCILGFLDRTEKTLNVRNIKAYSGVVDRLCGLVGRVLGYRSGGPGSIPGTTRKKKNVVGLRRVHSVS
jgi:hypothetical protein